MIPPRLVGISQPAFYPASFGETLPALAARALFTGAAVALIHGLCTGFRCFQEASALILRNFARSQLAQEQWNLDLKREHFVDSSVAQEAKFSFRPPVKAIEKYHFRPSYALANLGHPSHRSSSYCAFRFSGEAPLDS